MRYTVILLFAGLAFASCNKSSDPEIAKWEKQAENITIIRDDFGVPHVYGKTDADAVFGLMYAQCEDDFMRVERNYIWAIGRLAEVEGEEALYSDVRARMFMTQEEAIEAYQSCPAWLKELCNAFADGVNYYLYTHPDVEPALLTRFEPWMPMYFTEGSIGGDIERVSTRRIREFYQSIEEEVPAGAVGMLEEEVTDPNEEPRGSNGIAVSGDLTASGNAMLLINPHTTFYFRGEVHAVSEEGLNAYGAVTWGQFFVYQGFNEKTGWIHTSTYVDVIDEFIENVSGEDGSYQYRYGDEMRPVEQLEVTLKYKDGDSFGERTFPIFRTHRGPVTHMIDGEWVSTALMWEPVDALTQSYTRTKLSGHDEFREMMEMTTNSSNNTVYADSDGTIAYYHGNFIPRRDDSFNYRMAVDGSDPATDWQGLHTVEESITVVNPPNGWIQNCNSTPYTCCGEYSPVKSDYPSYMSIDRENFRGIHAIDLLEEADELTLDGLIDLAYDPYLPAFEALIPGLVNAFEKARNGNVEMAKAIDVLRNWDFTVSKESVGMTLGHFYAQHYNRTGERPGGMTFMQRISYFGSDSPDSEKLRVFAETLEQLNTRFGTWNIQWGEVNRFQRLANTIDWQFDDNAPSIPVGMASGNWGALAAYGDRSGLDLKKLYGTRGNSFVAVVEFGDRVRAKSILAGGQSGDKNSPHFNDQAQMYADAEFKEVAFYKEDVEARAEEMYQPGSRKQ